MSAYYYSFWLVPQEPDLANFQGIINTLAERFGTVPFCPHVTLYSGELPPSIEVGSWLEKVLQPVGPMELAIANLTYEYRFSKTLFVQLNQTPLLVQLVNRLVSAIPNAQLPPLDPHLSLLYHSLDNAIKQDLAEKITLPRPSIWFDQVQAIAAPYTFETQDHVASLRCIHSQLLITPLPP